MANTTTFMVWSRSMRTASSRRFLVVVQSGPYPPAIARRSDSLQVARDYARRIRGSHPAQQRVAVVDLAGAIKADYGDGMWVPASRDAIIHGTGAVPSGGEFRRASRLSYGPRFLRPVSRKQRRQGER